MTVVYDQSFLRNRSGWYICMLASLLLVIVNKTMLLLVELHINGEYYKVIVLTIWHDRMIWSDLIYRQDRYDMIWFIDRTDMIWHAIVSRTYTRIKAWKLMVVSIHTQFSQVGFATKFWFTPSYPERSHCLLG